MDLPFVVHDGESDSWVCRVTNTVSLLSPNKASNARFIFPPCSLGTTSISHRTLNHIVSCRPCTSSTDIVALSGRFRFVDGIVNGLKSLRSFPISEVFGRVARHLPFFRHRAPWPFRPAAYRSTGSACNSLHKVGSPWGFAVICAAVQWIFVLLGGQDSCCQPRRDSMSCHAHVQGNGHCIRSHLQRRRCSGSESGDRTGAPVQGHTTVFSRSCTFAQRMRRLMWVQLLPLTATSTWTLFSQQWTEPAPKL